MSILGAVTQGVSSSGIRMVVAGQEKMGKTTLCANAPMPLLVPLEVGYAGVTVPRTPMLQEWGHTQQLLNEITNTIAQGRFPYRTLVFDSVTAMERQIHDNVLQRDPSWRATGKKMLTMEAAHGGYGKAYSLANSEFDQFLATCDWIANAGINIILTAHVFSSKVMDPTAGEYDAWDLLLHSPKNAKTYGKRERLTQWADVIGFLYEPVFVSEAGKLSRAVSQNKGRVLGLSRTPSYVAGNRFGINVEVPIPMPPANGWNVFADCLQHFTGIDVHSR